MPLNVRLVLGAFVGTAAQDTVLCDMFSIEESMRYVLPNLSVRGKSFWAVDKCVVEGRQIYAVYLASFRLMLVRSADPAVFALIRRLGQGIARIWKRLRKVCRGRICKVAALFRSYQPASHKLPNQGNKQ